MPNSSNSALSFCKKSEFSTKYILSFSNKEFNFKRLENYINKKENLEKNNEFNNVKNDKKEYLIKNDMGAGTPTFTDNIQELKEEVNNKTKLILKLSDEQNHYKEQLNSSLFNSKLSFISSFSSLSFFSSFFISLFFNFSIL